MSLLRDPKREIPEDIERIADQLPASSAAARLRQLIGLLPRPIAPGYPNPNQQGNGEDPASVAANVAGNGFGSTSGDTIGDGTLDGGAITPGSLDPAAFASTLATVLLVAGPGNPALPNATYPIDQIIYNQSTKQLYKNVANVWTTIVNTTDLTGTISAAQIAAGAVTAGKIAANAVTAGTISAGAVNTAELAAGAITAAKIGAGEISTAKLVVGGIDLSTIGLTGSIVNGLLATDSIDARVIAAGAITATDITTGTLTGITITGVNITAGGSGFDGFTVVNGSGSSIGSWTAAGGLAASVAIATTSTVSAAGGIITLVASGVGSFPAPQTGMIGIDSGSGSFGRFYAYHSGGWHYVAFTAGFVVPAHEIRCPACGFYMKPGDDLIGVGDRWQADGALHGLWKHLSCAGRPTDSAIADSYEAAGANPDAKDVLEAATRDAIALAGGELPELRPMLVAEVDKP